MKHLKYKQIAILALCIIALSACNIRQISLEDENQSQPEQMQKTDDIHPAKTVIPVHLFKLFIPMAMQS